MTAFDEGKELYSEVMVLAAKMRPLNVKRFRKGDVRKAAERVYRQKNITEVPFNTWWGEVHKIGTSPKSGEYHHRRDDTIKARYTKMIESQDELPADDVLGLAFNCPNSTLSSIRSELKHKGYEFEYKSGKGLFVTQRPIPQEENEPDEMYQEPLTPSLTPVQACNTNEQLDTIISLLTELLKVWKSNG